MIVLALVLVALAFGLLLAGRIGRR